MPFLNSKSLEEEIPAKGIIDPFRKDRIEQGKYELSVEKEYFHTALEGGKKTVADNEQIVIPAGQLAILLTEETVKMPFDRIGFISIKFGAKVRGLINVSGFHVDPGFHGKLKFSVYNAGSSNALIDPLKPLFQIWLSTLTKPESKESAYDNSHKHQNQKSITAGDVEHLQQSIASPGNLLTEITNIKLELRYYRAFGGLAAAILLAALIVPAFKWAVEHWYGISSTPVPSAAASASPNTKAVPGIDEQTRSPTSETQAAADQANISEAKSGQSDVSSGTPGVSPGSDVDQLPTATQQDDNTKQAPTQGSAPSTK